MKDGISLNIGHGDWVGRLQSFTDQFDSSYWSRFQRCSVSEIQDCERFINRNLPLDFVEFLKYVGYGSFPSQFGGDIYSPEEIKMACAGPIRMVLGSIKWASSQDNIQFYCTRGNFNPAPDRFSGEAMILNGINLLDLVQIGTDGMGRYHQLHVATPPNSAGYYLLAPGGQFHDQAKNFGEFIEATIIRHQRDSETNKRE